VNQQFSDGDTIVHVIVRYAQGHNIAPKKLEKIMKKFFDSGADIFIKNKNHECVLKLLLCHPSEDEISAMNLEYETMDHSDETMEHSSEDNQDAFLDLASNEEAHLACEDELLLVDFTLH
jgi:hypothetical protein